MEKSTETHYVVRYTPDIENDIKRGWSGWQNQAWKTLNGWYYKSAPGDMAQAKWEELQEKREKYQSFDTPMEYICDMYDVESISEIDWVDVSNELEELFDQDLRWDEGCQMWRLCDHDGLSCFWLEGAETEAEAIEMAEGGSFSTDQARAYIADGKVEVVVKLSYQMYGHDVYVLKCTVLGAEL